ncbi:ATP synthase subunit 8 [Gossypium australe]|uniref:ATP synthase subunit 8 n=1 Tax=Gossypium australe TaxID=47621 RepID=A0A5B6WY87_9ROSI|nr:ATP synthase subunit 8 [Gossypium australe]
MYPIWTLLYSKYPNGVMLLTYWEKKRKITLISCFGEISGSRGIERNIFYLISKPSYSNPGRGITCRNDIMLIHKGRVEGGSQLARAAGTFAKIMKEAALPTLSLKLVRLPYLPSGAEKLIDS